jgi:hypothetical protein
MCIGILKSSKFLINDLAATLKSATCTLSRVIQRQEFDALMVAR